MRVIECVCLRGWLQAHSREFFQDRLGPKLGEMLWDFATGRDNRQAAAAAPPSFLPPPPSRVAFSGSLPYIHLLLWLQESGASQRPQVNRGGGELRNQIHE